MRNALVLFLLLTQLTMTSLAQDSARYQRQASILVDNDVFTSLFRDQYYSSGLFGIYSWLHQSNDEAKKIRSVTLVQRMFTPKFLSWSDVNDFDRPYAGHLSVILNERTLRKRMVLSHELELGWMGPGSLTGTIQESWHGSFGLPEPKGWDFEIQNSPIVNYYGLFAGQLLKIKGLEIISETRVSAGTAFNNINQQIMLRTGKLKGFMSGSLHNGQLGNIKPSKKSEIAQEIVLFYSPGFEYNLYNSTIEGNLFGQEAPHTEKPVRDIVQHRFGIYFSWSSFDITIDYYRRTKETTQSSSHQYAGVQLNQRF